MPLIDAAPDTPEIAVDHGSAYELAQSVLCYLDEEEAALFPESSAWRARLAARVSPELAGKLTLLRGCPFVPMKLIGLATEARPPRDAAAFVTLVRGTPPAELVAAALGGPGAGLSAAAAAAEVRRAQAGGRAERRALVATWLRDLEDAEEASAIELLERPAVETKRGLVDIFARWHREVFGPDEATLVGRLAADAERTALLAARLPARELLETVTNGVRLADLSGVRRILLIPQVCMGPWNASTHWGGTLIVTHPIAPERGPLDAAQVARLYKALGDESRLRLLRALADGERTLSELTQQVGLAKSTAHHHLVILRDAGLVATSLEDDRRYQLRADAVAAAGEPLQALLRKEP